MKTRNIASESLFATISIAAYEMLTWSIGIFLQNLSLIKRHWMNLLAIGAGWACALGLAVAQSAATPAAQSPLARADMAAKAGDDATIKVCVMFDQAMTAIPLLQTAILALGHSVMGQEMPHATLCYVWDSRYPVGTACANPYTARVMAVAVMADSDNTKGSSVAYLDQLHWLP